MKKLARLGLFMAAITLVFTSCSKDQKYVKWLSDGDYTLTSLTKNGVEEDRGFTLSEHTQSHSECKVKDEECEGSVSYSGHLTGDSTNTMYTGSSTFTYKIHDKGEKMTVTTIESTFAGVSTPCTEGCVVVFDIIEMEKDRHVLESTDANGDVWVRTMEKI